MPEIKMVNGQLLPVGVTDRRLIRSLLAVERREFLPTSLKSISHIDIDLKLKDGSAVSPARYLMPAAPFGQLVQAAQVTRNDAVLDIGCTTGYSSAVLSKLANRVVGLECDPQLASSARAALATLSISNAQIVSGPLEDGWLKGAPYDVIFIGGSVPAIPQSLVAQLSDYRGRLVAIIDDGQSMSAQLFVKSGSNFAGRKIFDAGGRPLPGFSRPDVFVF